MRLASALLTAEILSGVPAVLAQIPPPSDLELGAAYCLGQYQVGQEMIAQQHLGTIDCQHTLPGLQEDCHRLNSELKRSVSQLNTVTSRLQGYLFAKGIGVPGPSINGDMIAYARGRADAVTFAREVDQCTQQCPRDATLPKCLAACNARLDSQGTALRTRCEHVLAQLPF